MCVYLLEVMWTVHCYEKFGSCCEVVSVTYIATNSKCGDTSTRHTYVEPSLELARKLQAGTTLQELIIGRILNCISSQKADEYCNVGLR